VPVYVHDSDLPIAAGEYLPQYANPLDRWILGPVMGMLPPRTRQRITAAGSITDVVRPLDPQEGALADLEPQVLAPGHGGPLTTATATTLRALAQNRSRPSRSEPQ
jgi:hypothetical protein